jgi:hypothetical protein
MTITLWALGMVEDEILAERDGNVAAAGGLRDGLRQQGAQKWGNLFFPALPRWATLFRP